MEFQGHKFPLLCNSNAIRKHILVTYLGLTSGTNSVNAIGNQVRDVFCKRSKRSEFGERILRTQYGNGIWGTYSDEYERNSETAFGERILKRNFGNGV